MVLSGQKVSVDVCCAAFVCNTDVFCGLSLTHCIVSRRLEDSFSSIRYFFSNDRRQVCRPLYDLMSANKPDDIDLFFMGKAPHTRFAPKSMAGQAGHHSD